MSPSPKIWDEPIAMAAFISISKEIEKIDLEN